MSARPAAAAKRAIDEMLDLEVEFTRLLEV